MAGFCRTEAGASEVPYAHRRLDSLARKLGEIVPTEAAQRGSSGQTGRFNWRGRLDERRLGAIRQGPDVF